MQIGVDWGYAFVSARSTFLPQAGETNRVGWSGSEQQDQETLELVEFRQLNEAELEQARAGVMALEKRAY